MPNKFVTLDTGFPTFTGEESLPQKVDAIINYQYQLQESLRYMLRHLDSGNFDAEGLRSITEPIAISLKEDFNQTDISIDASGIEAVISGLESTLEMYVKADAFKVAIDTLDGDITSLELNMNGLATRVQNTEGNVSTLEQTVNGFETRVTNVEGEFSYLEQTVNSFSTRISNAENDASEALQTAEGFETRVSNAEGDITSLEQTVDSFTISVSSGSTGSTTFKLTADGATLSTQTVALHVKAANIYGKLTADQIETGALTAGTIQGDTIYINDDNEDTVGFIYTTDTDTGSGIEIEAYLGGAKLTSYGGNVYIKSYKGYGDYLGAPYLMLGRADVSDPLTGICQLGHGALVLDSNSFGDYLPDNPVYGQVYFLRV